MDTYVCTQGHTQGHTHLLPTCIHTRVHTYIQPMHSLSLSPCITHSTAGGTFFLGTSVKNVTHPHLLAESPPGGTAQEIALSGSLP